jgi:hypothetical protein
MFKDDGIDAQWGFGRIWKHIHGYINMDVIKKINTKP